MQGVDWDEGLGSSEIFRIAGPGHQGWSTRVKTELGNYDYLLGADVRKASSPNTHHDYGMHRSITAILKSVRTSPIGAPGCWK
jgi:hypothetical protein